MSYSTWHTYGYGICVDNIETTAEKLLKLASMKENVLKEVREYLDEIYPNGYKDEDLTLEDFDELEGDYCERGVAFVLHEVINEITVDFADDYNGTPYILYIPSYPWYMKEEERNLTEEDVVNVFKKYVSVLTDEPIVIDYYDVENGG